MSAFLVHSAECKVHSCGIFFQKIIEIIGKADIITVNCTLSTVNCLLHFLHRFSAAAGDHLSCLQVQDFPANRAVDITFFFCPLHFN